MAETEEDWVQLAMGDVCLAANLLLRLVGDRPPSSRSWLDWTVRGRRSRALSRIPDGRTNKDPAEELKAEPARASPSTPLSWSRATSTSGGGGPSEESHPFPLDNCHAGRSKATLAGGAHATGVSAPGKRPPRQKKKSLFELKEEESLLLKERLNLKQELASLRLSVEEGRAANESLKRLKVNSVTLKQGQLVLEDHRHQREAAVGSLKGVVQRPCSPMVEIYEKTLLPDLNIPLEEQ